MQFLIMRSLSFLPGPIILEQCWIRNALYGNTTNVEERRNCYDYNVDRLSWNIAKFGCIASGISLIKILKTIFLCHCDFNAT